MTAQSDGYSHGAHITKVRKAARASGIKGAAYAVLTYLCDAAEYGQPTVRVAKATICARTAYHWDTVRLALRALRAAGFIDPVAYATGGRHRATIYSLRTGKGAENPPPLQTEISEKGGGKSVQKGAENPVKRGRKIHPPTKDHPYDPSREGERRSLDANRGERQADRAGSAKTGQELKEAQAFSRIHKMDGFDEAMRRMKAGTLLQEPPKQAEKEESP